MNWRSEIANGPLSLAVKSSNFIEFITFNWNWLISLAPCAPSSVHLHSLAACRFISVPSIHLIADHSSFHTHSVHSLIIHSLVPTTSLFHSTSLVQLLTLVAFALIARFVRSIILDFTSLIPPHSLCFLRSILRSTIQAMFNPWRQWLIPFAHTLINSSFHYHFTLH